MSGERKPSQGAEDRSSATIPDGLIPEAGCGDPAPQVIALPAAKKGKVKPEYIPPFCYWHDKFGIVIDEKAVADHVTEKFSAISFNKVLYCYHDGKYVENRGEIEAEVQRVLDGAQTGERFTRIVREVITRITYAKPFEDYPFNPRRDLINCANCVIQIDPDTGEVSELPHSPEYRFNYRLAVTYDPEADGGPMKAILSDYVDEEAVPVLYEIPALALLQTMADDPYKRSYLLLAQANAAKSTYLKMLREYLFGDANVASVSLLDICTDRFANGALEGKLVNIYDELKDTKIKGVDKFKALTGSFAHTIERKNRDRYEGTIKAIHIFSANKAPATDESADDDAAWWTRWEIVAFTNVFPVDPGWLKRTVTPAMVSGWFNDILVAMAHIAANGVFREADPGRVRAAWNESAEMFLEFRNAEMEPIRANENLHEFDKEQLLAAYRQWGADNGKRLSKFPLSVTGLTVTLMRHGFVTSRVGNKDTRKHRYSAPFKWRAESPYASTPKRGRPTPAAAVESGGGLDEFIGGEA